MESVSSLFYKARGSVSMYLYSLAQIRQVSIVNIPIGNYYFKMSKNTAKLNSPLHFDKELHIYQCIPNEVRKDMKI